LKHVLSLSTLEGYDLRPLVEGCKRGQLLDDEQLSAINPDHEPINPWGDAAQDTQRVDHQGLLSAVQNEDPEGGAEEEDGAEQPIVATAEDPAGDVGEEPDEEVEEVSKPISSRAERARSRRRRRDRS